MRSYIGLKGAPSPQDKPFACPADTFYYDEPRNDPARLISQSMHLQSNFSYSSYAFNAGNAVFATHNPPILGVYPGIMGRKLSSIGIPAKTVLVAEFPALNHYSWHQPSPPGKQFYNNAPNMLSFVDGHVSYVKIYLFATPTASRLPDMITSGVETDRPRPPLQFSPRPAGRERTRSAKRGVRNWPRYFFNRSN
jgi:hypothetical protein